MATVVADAVSYLLSAMGIGRSGAREAPARDDPTPLPLAGPPPSPPREGITLTDRGARKKRRHILSDPVLRPLLLNTVW